MSQNVEALLQSIEVSLPFELLDLGCGPGRDLRAPSPESSPLAGVIEHVISGERQAIGKGAGRQ